MEHYTAGISKYTLHTGHLLYSLISDTQHVSCRFLVRPAWKLSSMVDSSTCSAHWRFMYFHGQRHARLSNDQTVYSRPIRERSTLISLLSPLLFLAPEVHLGEMEKLWTDEVIIEIAWKSFMKKLLDEWNYFIFLVRFMPCCN